MRTIGARLSGRKGFGPGFDLLRVALAICVVAWHEHYVVAGALPGSMNADQTWLVWFPGYGILVMFFALSGFLIAASGMRLSLTNFLINRGLRIMPALAVEIVLSAFILGPVFTNLSLHAYLTDPQTYKYFTNVFGLVNYFLPGVFTGNPAPEVNNSLWTVPFEYMCYGLMAGLIVVGLLRRPALVVACAAIFIAIGIGLSLAGFAAPAQAIPSAVVAASPLQKLLGTAFFLGRGSRLIVAFLLGVASYLYRDRIPYDRRILVACVAICAFAAVLGPAPWMTLPLLNAIVCPALVYITAFLGVSDLPRLPFFSKGDYSYGIYLYGFPVQQSVWTLAPGLNPFLQFGIALVTVIMFAAFSWHAIEKPILTLRRRFSFVARERLAPGIPGELASSSERFGREARIRGGAEGHGERCIRTIGISTTSPWQLARVLRGEVRHLVAFRQTYPGIDIRLTVGNMAQVASAIRSGIAELGFVEGRIADPSLTAEDIAHDQLVIVVGPHHPWQSGGRITPADLFDTEWVLRELGSGTRSVFEAALEGFGLVPSALPVAIELPTNEAVRAAVEAGLGATAISASVAAPSLEAGLSDQGRAAFAGPGLRCAPACGATEQPCRRRPSGDHRRITDQSLKPIDSNASVRWTRRVIMTILRLVPAHIGGKKDNRHGR